MAALTLSAALLPLAGCGKGFVAAQHSGKLNSVAPIAPEGAAGQITRNTTRLGGSGPIVDAAAIAAALHPAAAGAERPEAALLVNRENYPAALAASVLTGAPLHAALLFGEAGNVPEATEIALSALQPSGAKAHVLGGAQVLEAGTVATPRGLLVRGLPGRGPAALAASIASFQQALSGAPAKAVLIVNPWLDPAFSMPAAGLAAEAGAPILFAEASGLPAPTRETLAELRRSQTRIFVIGPEKVIGESALAELRRYGPVKRIAGASPAETAIAVARFSERIGQQDFGFGVQEPGHGLAFASAAHPLDAPAAAALSTTGDFGPLLLLEGADQVPQPLVSYLEDIRGAYNSQVPPTRSLYNHGWIVGGAEAISAASQYRLDLLLEIVERTNGTASPGFTP